MREPFCPMGLTPVDRAGNSGSSAPLDLAIESRPDSVRLAAVPSVFSPNGDGVKDTVRIEATVGVREGINGWTYRIFNALGQTVKSLDGKDSTPPARRASSPPMANTGWTWKSYTPMATGRRPKATCSL